MLKQKKNLNIKKNFKNRIKEKIKVNRIKQRLRNHLKNKFYTINPNFQQFTNIKNFKFFCKKINIRITPNNVFCTLKNISKNKIITIGSSGKYKIKTSKKTIRYSTKTIISSFLEEIKKNLNSKHYIINIIGPIKIRKAILKQLSKYLKKKSIIINIDNKKCFNGCRPPKKKRKKQKGL
jgi:ribosomal protein S11